MSPADNPASRGAKRPPWRAALAWAVALLLAGAGLAAVQPELVGRLLAAAPREPSAGTHDLGKGQRPHGLDRPRYDQNLRPIPIEPNARTSLAGETAGRQVTTVAQLERALRVARPGEVIELVPGRYPLQRALRLGADGSPDRPIVLRAALPGTTMLIVDTVQGLIVDRPYWAFENLDWQGMCASDSSCEHALHIVGSARGTVIVNNRILDFNAHIKVNGERGQWPDDGLLQFSTLANTRPRDTDNPVVPFDLVGASGWQVLDSRIENAVKARAGVATYSLFMKGGGRSGRIERNVVVCSTWNMDQPGQRVGISVGNGGTAPGSCRDGRCEHEHSGTVVANNVVAHCNDVGIDVAKGADTRVLNNTLINTLGILVRNPPSDAQVSHNLVEGTLHARRGTGLQADANLLADRVDRWLPGADRLDMRWRERPPAWAGGLPASPTDFCGRPRPASAPPGAINAWPC